MQSCAGNPQGRYMRKPAHVHRAGLGHRPLQVPKKASPHRDISLGYSTRSTCSTQIMSSHRETKCGMETEKSLNRRARTQHISSKYGKETSTRLDWPDVSGCVLQRNTLENQIQSVWDGLFCASWQSGSIPNIACERITSWRKIHCSTDRSQFQSSHTKCAAEEVSECMVTNGQWGRLAI